MMEFEFIEKLRRELRPLMITMELVSRDHSYFLVMDGSKTFRKSPGTTWNDDYMTFEVFTSMFVRQYFTPISTHSPTQTISEYEIGNVFDMVKNA